MTETQLLKSIIKEKGIKYRFIAEELGISRQSLSNKITNKIRNGKESEFTVSEVYKLCKILEITDPQEINDIFFAERVEQYSTVNK